jgi:hypothetical protein
MSTGPLNEKRGSLGSAIASPTADRRALVTSGGLVASPPPGLEKKSVVREFSVAGALLPSFFGFFFSVGRSLVRCG